MLGYLCLTSVSENTLLYWPEHQAGKTNHCRHELKNYLQQEVFATYSMLPVMNCHYYMLVHAYLFILQFMRDLAFLYWRPCAAARPYYAAQQLQWPSSHQMEPDTFRPKTIPNFPT